MRSTPPWPIREFGKQMRGPRRGPLSSAAALTQTDAFLNSEITRWGGVIKAAGIKAE